MTRIPRPQRDHHPLQYYGIKHDPLFSTRRVVIDHFGYDARTTREVEETRSDKDFRPRCVNILKALLSP